VVIIYNPAGMAQAYVTPALQRKTVKTTVSQSRQQFLCRTERGIPFSLVKRYQLSLLFSTGEIPAEYVRMSILEPRFCLTQL